MLFYQKVTKQHFEQKADDLLAVNIGMAGGKETNSYLKKLREAAK